MAMEAAMNINSPAQAVLWLRAEAKRMRAALSNGVYVAGYAHVRPEIAGDVMSRIRCIEFAAEVLEHVDGIRAAERSKTGDAIVVLEDLLDRCLDFIEPYSDVTDGSYGEPSPNAAMQLVSAIRDVVGGAE